MADVAPVLRATAKALADIGEAHCGSGAWGLMGVDGQQPFAVRLMYNGHSWCTVSLELGFNELGDASRERPASSAP